MDVLLFHTVGMNIYLVETWNRGGGRSLTVRVEGAGTAALTTDGTTATWTTLSAVEGRSAAGACITSDGAAPNAT